VCVCVCVCARVWVRVCVHACVHVCVFSCCLNQDWKEQLHPHCSCSYRLRLHDTWRQILWQAVGRVSSMLHDPLPAEAMHGLPYAECDAEKRSERQGAVGCWVGGFELMLCITGDKRHTHAHKQTQLHTHRNTHTHTHTHTHKITKRLCRVLALTRLWCAWRATKRRLTQSCMSLMV